MISNQILQNTIDGLKGISKVDFSVLDTEGKELASTLDNAQERNSAVISFVESPADSQVIQGCQFLRFLTSRGLSTYCWRKVTARRRICSAKLRHSRSTVCW